MGEAESARVGGTWLTAVRLLSAEHHQSQRRPFFFNQHLFLATERRPSTSFHGLSVELLEQIFSELHYFGTCNLKLVGHSVDCVLKPLTANVQVNRCMCDVMTSSPLIQYRAKLFFYGFWDDFCGRSTIDISARGRQLCANHSHWSRLEWAERTTIRLPGTDFGVIGSVFHAMADNRTVNFVRLPLNFKGSHPRRMDSPRPRIRDRTVCHRLIILESQVPDHPWWVVFHLQ